MQLNSNKAMPDSDSKWKLLSPSAKTALGILSVDNLKVSDFGMDLLLQISQGRITHRQAREMLRTPSGQVLKAGDPVITYVARNLEPYRGFHVFMRALEKIQREHKTCHAVIVGGDDVSYGSKPKDAPNWREKMLSEVSLDPTRTHFMGKLPYETYKTVLQVSAAHVYLTYPFVLSWSMLEAQASGCLIIGSSTSPVEEIIQPGLTGYLADFHDPQKIARTTVEALADSKHSAGIKLNAINATHTRLNLSNGHAAYFQMLRSKQLDDNDSYPNKAA